MKRVGLILLLLLSACSNNTSSDVDEYEDYSVGCENPEIKGNLTTYNGEMIYHVPGGQFYDVTDAEEMFCTEEEAIDAGYRKSER
ncbi:sunset domain-containing protein [Heyndrickxia oleronia]|uniref:sunset domain-containing protein n=1 Tax=Heyndrickxia oleronia TaxID=38875 RepID=UPI001B092D9D|nr:hypothetical protein [Heyndrickxia oleronia]GIN38369.1 hypothetical protein J19TS1_13180 [Heyndrickxia oleronia]